MKPTALQTTPIALQMIPHRLHFSVLIYSKDKAPTIRTDQLREHIASQMPTGTGVGDVGCVIEGPLNMVEQDWGKK